VSEKWQERDLSPPYLYTLSGEKHKHTRGSAE
jgi:hypothetical protein